MIYYGLKNFITPGSYIYYLNFMSKENNASLFTAITKQNWANLAKLSHISLLEVSFF